MEIKTTKDIMYEYVTEEEHCLRLYDDNDNSKWVEIGGLIKELDNVINKINSERDIHPNYITKTQVASYLSELKNILSSNSEPKKSKTNKNYKVD